MTYIKTNFQINKGSLVNLRGRKSTLSGPHIPVPTFPLSTPPPGSTTCSCVVLVLSGIIYIGIGHYVQTLESYWAPPFWIISRSRENMGAAILNNYENTWLNLHTNEIITDRFSKNVIYLFFYFYSFFFFRGWHGTRTRDFLIMKQLD